MFWYFLLPDRDCDAQNGNLIRDLAFGELNLLSHTSCQIPDSLFLKPGNAPLTSLWLDSSILKQIAWGCTLLMLPSYSGHQKGYVVILQTVTVEIMQYKTLATCHWDQMCPSVTNT